MKRALALLLGSLGLASAVELPFTTCGEDNLGVERIEVSEYPFQPNDAVSMSVAFAPKVEIDGGKLTLALAIRGTKLFETTADLCGDTSLNCPLPAGQEVTASTTQTIPAGAPPVKIQVIVTGKDVNGSQLTCLQTEVEFAHVSRLSDEEMRTRPAITSGLLAEIAMAPESRTWTAHWSPRFANATIKQAAGMMGAILPGHPMHLSLPEKPLAAFRTSGPNDSIPASFDAREAWPQCKGVIGHIRDQSACGSCWAVASTECLNDRLCIAFNYTTLLSPTDTLSCCTGASCGFSMGCNGGQPAGAWSFFTETGIVTGGDYPDTGKNVTCLPYPFPGCAHHVEPTAEVPACPEEDYETPRCRITCSERGYETAYLMDKHKAKRAYALRKSVEAIQREIMEEGPVTAAFTVYQDFLTYKGGVYQHAAGTPLGGHAVKIIGWGQDDVSAWWLVQNQWGELWGEQGLFRIVRGQNECGIEEEITAGTV